MTTQQIRDLLERGVEDAREVDLADVAWAGGRRERNRRMALAGTVVGGAAAAATVAVLLGSGAPEQPEPAPPAQTSTVEAVAPAGTPVLLALTPDGAEPEWSGRSSPAAEQDVTGATWQVDPLGEWFGDGRARFGPATEGVTFSYDGARLRLSATCLEMTAPGRLADGGRLDVTGEWTVVADGAAADSCASDAEAWQQLFAQRPSLSKDGDTLLLSGLDGVMADSSDGLHVEVSLTLQRGAGARGYQRSSPWEAASGAWEAASGGWTDVAGPTAPDGEPGVLVLGESVALSFEAQEGSLPSMTLVGVCDGNLLSPAGLRSDGVLLVGGTGTYMADCPRQATPEEAEELAEAESVILPLLLSFPSVAVDGDQMVITGRIPAGRVPEYAAPRIQESTPDPSVNALPSVQGQPAAVLPYPAELGLLPRADSALPEVVEVPVGPYPTPAEAPMDRAVLASTLEEDDHLRPIALGSDGRWRQADFAVDALMGTGPAENPHYREVVSQHSTSPDGTVVAVGERDGIRLWDVQTGGSTVIDVPSAGWISGISWSADTGQVLAAGEEESIVVDPASGEVTTRTGSGPPDRTGVWQLTAPRDAQQPAIVLQRADEAGAVLEQIPVGLEGADGGPQLHTDTWIARTFSGEPVDSTSGSQVFVVAVELAEAETHLLTSPWDPGVQPVRWLDDGQVVLRTSVSDHSALVLWDVQTGEFSRLARLDLGGEADPRVIAVGDLSP